MTINYAVRDEMLRLHRDVEPNAYQRGFEHYRYAYVYRNDYPLGSADWAEYCRGNEDARKAAELERP